MKKLNLEQYKEKFQKSFEIFDFQTAIKFGEKILQCQPENIDILINLGWSYDQIGIEKNNEQFIEKAQFLLKKILKQDKNNILALRRIGTTYLHLNQPNEALLYYKKTYKLAQKDQEDQEKNNIANDISNAFRTMKKYQQAFIWYKKSLSNITSEKIKKNATNHFHFLVALDKKDRNKIIYYGHKLLQETNKKSLVEKRFCKNIEEIIQNYSN